MAQTQMSIPLLLLAYILHLVSMIYDNSIHPYVPQFKCCFIAILGLSPAYLCLIYWHSQ